MPARKLISEKIAEFLGSMSHSYRIRIIEELYTREQNVSSLQTILGTSHSTVSQHLKILKAHKIVKQRRVGNQVFYRLTQLELASWLLYGLNYIEGELHSDQITLSAVNDVKTIWKHMPDRLKKMNKVS